MRGYRVLAVLPLLALLSGLGGCGLSGTNEGGYIEGDGQVVTYALDKRDDPVSLTGKTLQGKPYDLARQRGKVVVVNVWGAWCNECIKEAPLLRAAYDQLKKKYGDKVAFLGIDVRDSSTATPLAFERGNDLTYPSLYSPDSAATQPFRDRMPNTTPATLVLDPQGRVAAVIGGAVPSELTLVDVVEDVLNGTKKGTKAS